MRLWLIAAGLWLLSGCGKVEQRSSLILLAPFEGRYREVGYEALYAARLALAETQSAFDLLPVDDGGTPEFAVQRARAIDRMENAAAVILLGQYAVSPEVQEALSPLPAWIVGWWGHRSQFSHISELFPEHILGLTDQPYPQQLTELAQIPDLEAVGDVGGLLSFVRLRLTLGLPIEDVTVLSAGRLPDHDFSQRYLNSAPFALPPRLLASQVYDAVMLIARDSQRRAEDHESPLRLYAYRLDAQGELRLDHIVE